MKYFLIIIAALVLAQPAYAAKEVQGSVPVVQPLQPAAVGISANLNHNIKLQAPLQGGNSGQTAASQNSQQNQDAPQQQPYKKSSSWLWWLLIILGLGIIFIWFKRKDSAV